MNQVESSSVRISITKVMLAFWQLRCVAGPRFWAAAIAVSGDRSPLLNRESSRHRILAYVSKGTCHEFFKQIFQKQFMIAQYLPSPALPRFYSKLSTSKGKLCVSTYRQLGILHKSQPLEHEQVVTIMSFGASTISILLGIVQPGIHVVGNWV